MNNIKSYLESKNLKFWTIEEIEIERDELYSIKDEIESKRKVIQEKCWITVYSDNESGVGSSSVLIESYLSFDDQKKIIDSAILDSRSISNPFYEIEQSKFEYREIPDHPIDLKDIHREIYSFKDAFISSSEIFVETKKSHFINSKGNSSKNINKNISIEVVMLSQDREKESQFYIYGDPVNLDVGTLLKSQARNLEASSNTVSINSGRYEVTFTNNSLPDFFDYFKANALGSAVYSNTSKFSLGERVSKFNLDLYSDPTFKGREQNHDSYGYPLNKFTIIESGILKNIVADNVYSQYLKVDYTGAASNFVIGLGNNSYEDLTTKGQLVIDRVSHLTTSSSTGDFSAEVRLAHIIEDGKRKSISGITISGNINQFDNLKLSNERVVLNNYIGPNALSLKGVDVVSREDSSE